MKKDRDLGQKFTPFLVVAFVVILLYVISLLIPLAWALMTSLKSNTEFRVNIIGFPKQLVFNYVYVFKRYYVPVSGEKIYMARLFLYSLLYAGGCALTNTLVPCLTAYTCAKFPYKLSAVIHTTVVIVMIIPIIGSLPAEVQMASDLRLYNHIWGLWIMKANFLGMYFLVFYNVFKAFPSAYSEAAKIDGASNFAVMVRIMLPLVRNTFFTVYLLNFITYWNDYQTPLIFIPSYPTVALGMYRMAKTTINELAKIPMRLTAAMLMFLPIFILFVAFNKRLLGNLTLGGIKG